MQRSRSLCMVLWVCWFCSASTQNQQRKHSPTKFCDPSFNDQWTGGGIQTCSSGFYRERVGGQCVPCSCNGLSNQCDQQTGNCVNCRFNTDGDHCERCKHGFYGDAASRTCRACPCPSTHTSFALACVDAGSGLVECLCNRGYSGARCERCAFGYYGNPTAPGGSCKPCSCQSGGLNVCDARTGECITSGNSSCGDACHNCGGCVQVLLLDSEEMDDGLARLQQQLQNAGRGPAPLARLNDLEVNASETEVLLRSFNTAATHLTPQLDQLETHVADLRSSCSRLSEQLQEVMTSGGRGSEVTQKMNGTKLKAEHLLCEAEALLTESSELLKRLSEDRPGHSEPLSEQQKIRMMDEAQLVVVEMRGGACRAQRESADGEQQEALTLLDSIRNRTGPSALDLDQTAVSSLGDVSELLSDCEDAVNRTKDENLRSVSVLQHLQSVGLDLDRQRDSLRPVTEDSTDLVRDIRDVLSELEDLRTELESHAAQLDGAKLELLRTFQHRSTMKRRRTKDEAVTTAEEQSEQLSSAVTVLQEVLQDASELLAVLTTGADDSIVIAMETAAARSTEAAQSSSQEVMEGGVVDRGAELRGQSAQLETESNDTEKLFKVMSQEEEPHRGRLEELKEKGERMKKNMTTFRDELREISREDTAALMDSGRTLSSTSNNTVTEVQLRLRDILQEVGGVIVQEVGGANGTSLDDMLMEAHQALKNLNKALPVLRDRFQRVESLGAETSPGGNVTESIRRIKDIIEETRHCVTTIQTPTGSLCRRPREIRLSDPQSWIRYTVPQQDLNHRPHFSLDVQTRSSRGLILHVAGGGTVPLLALYVANGNIRMSLGKNRTIRHKEKSNDGEWHRVELSVERSSFHLLVDGIRVTDGHLPDHEGSSLDLNNPVYLGAAPGRRTTTGHHVPADAAISCVRDFRMNEVAVGEPEATHRTSPCVHQLTEAGTYFSGGHVVLDKLLPSGSDWELSLELRPQRLTGLLLHADTFSVFLMENQVCATVNRVSVSVTPADSFCDGHFHVVTVSTQQDLVRLEVDGVSEEKGGPSPSSSPSSGPHSLHIGGTMNQDRVPVSAPFIGCLRNVKLNGKPVDFGNEGRVVDPVILRGCPGL